MLGDDSVNVCLGFRTVRIGTLKTYSLSERDVLKLDSKRLKFSVKLRQEPQSTQNQVLKVVVPCKHITFVKSYLGRGCPVIWLQTSKECTRHLQNTVGMAKGKVPAPFYDPSSKVVAERYIGIIAAEDPIPYHDVFLFKQVIQKIYQERSVQEEDFHGKISQTQCNAMLVEVTNIADKITMFKRRATEQPNIDLTMSVYEGIKFSASLLANDPAEAAHNLGATVPSHQSDSDLESIPKAGCSEKSHCQDAEGTLPNPGPSTASVPKNINRARKSIPKSSRAISLESQLDEIRAKAGLDARDNQVDIVTVGNTSGNSFSVDAVKSSSAKKKRPKDPFLWKGRGRRRIKKFDGNPLAYQHHTPKAPVTPISAPLEEKPTSASINKLSKNNHEELAGRHATTDLCTCLERSPFIVITGSDAIKCMAFDNVDGRLTACIDVVKSPVMMKASQHVPPLALCDIHRERMLRHECCPGCGMFCAGGSFLVCVSTKECPHRFHRDCMLLHRQTKDCLHCGGPISQVRKVHIKPCQDHNLRWVIAGHDPFKMDKKRLTAERERVARIGYGSRRLESPSENGIVKIVRPGLTISTSRLPPGMHREALEEALCGSFDASKKMRISPSSVLQLIQRGDIVKVVQFFIDADEHEFLSVIKNPSTLNKAVVCGNTAIVDLLILMGAEPNAKDVEGKTALLCAEETENVQLINCLVELGADVALKDVQGLTCLHHAAKTGHTSSCASLLKHHCDIINAPANGGWTPISLAAENGHSDIAKYLEYFGADLYIPDQQKNTCLLWAALQGNLDLVLMCIQKHCDINFKNALGETALHIATRRGHFECVSSLINWGADYMLKDSNGRSLLECSTPEDLSHILLKLKIDLQKMMSKQGLPEKDLVLSKDLSSGFENLPVSCVNNVDDAPCPTNCPQGFKYVTSNVHTSQDTIIKSPSSKMQSCQCFSHCMNDSCLCCLLSERCWYDDQGILLPEFDMTEPPLVFECSETCWCPPSCRNRVVQKGIRYNLQVHRTVAMGWSVRTLDTIPRGAFVCEYVGELISDAEADVREDDSYLFDLENKDGEMFCIDARYYGNVSRFINHLCNPNLVPIRVFIDHHDIRFPRLAYFSTQVIEAGEELGFDYGDRFWDVKCREFMCGCGQPQCKYSKEAYRLKNVQGEKIENESES